MDLLGFVEMPPRRIDPRAIDDVSDVVEERISKKVKENFRSEIEEVKATFRSKMALMKSHMIVEIISAIGGVPRHMDTKDGYEEAAEDYELVGSGGEGRIDRVEKPMGNRASHFDRFGSQLKLKHKKEISDFLDTLNPKDLINWIGEFEDYFDLEEIKV